MTVCEAFDSATGDGCRATATDRTPGGRLLCMTHMGEHWERQERINRDYPDSDVPPAWFDPMAAGERWNDDY
jgi:hypothetical protein